MKKKLLALAFIIAVIVVGEKAISAASTVFYSYPNYSIQSGKTTETQPLMRVNYDVAKAKLKVKSTGDGLQRTKFQLYSSPKPNQAAAYVSEELADLVTATIGAVTLKIGSSSDHYWRMRNTTLGKGVTYASWSGELYYISSTL